MTTAMMSIAPDELVQRTSFLLARGRLGAARPLVAALRRLEPHSSRQYAWAAVSR
jgi:hypothetical protein